MNTVPNVTELTVDELAAVVRNDTETFAAAGAVEVPAAIEELARRGDRQAYEVGDEDGRREARRARAIRYELVEEAKRNAAELDARIATEREDELAADADERERELDAIDKAEQAEPAEREDRPAEADKATFEAEREAARREDWRALLELNGFNAIRTSALGAAQAAGALPLEAIDAAIEHTKAAIARLRLNTDNPRAPQARRQAEYELRILELTRTFRRELGRADEAQAARDRLNGGQG